ncbi:hypothetical protein [Streptomyces prasinus]|uniref:hypothetical protein n=1 Tax=Streptomyces prasinus TaxID=67345 RepID=UPI000A9D4C3D|nr:hypothetical protein [Streptomyces prasinus]
METIEAIGVLAVSGLLVAWLLWSLWNLYRIPVGLRDGSWRRPLWWARLWSLALFVGCAAWLRGVLSGGFDVGETCAYAHHQAYDSEYRAAHVDEFGRLFPLSNKCNGAYDLVPVWVNPTVLNCAAFVLLASAVLLWFGVARLTGRGAARLADPPLGPVSPSPVTHR